MTLKDNLIRDVWWLQFTHSLERSSHIKTQSQLHWFCMRCQKLKFDVCMSDYICSNLKLFKKYKAVMRKCCTTPVKKEKHSDYSIKQFNIPKSKDQSLKVDLWCTLNLCKRCILRFPIYTWPFLEEQFNFALSIPGLADIFIENNKCSSTCIQSESWQFLSSGYAVSTEM